MTNIETSTGRSIIISWHFQAAANRIFCKHFNEHLEAKFQFLWFNTRKSLATKQFSNNGEANKKQLTFLIYKYTVYITIDIPKQKLFIFYPMQGDEFNTYIAKYIEEKRGKEYIYISRLQQQRN